MKKLYFLFILFIFCFSAQSMEPRYQLKYIDHNVVKIIFYFYAQKFKRGKDLMPYRLVSKKWKQMVDEYAHWDYFVKAPFRGKGVETIQACLTNPNSLLTANDVHDKLNKFSQDGQIMPMSAIEILVEEINHNSFFEGYNNGAKVNGFMYMKIRDHALYEPYYKLIKAILNAQVIKKRRSLTIDSIQSLWTEISLKKLCKSTDGKEHEVINQYKRGKILRRYPNKNYFY